MKSKLRREYVARHMIAGQCRHSVVRSTIKQAIEALGEVSIGTVEVFYVEFQLHSAGKWWTETKRVRVEGGAA